MGNLTLILSAAHRKCNHKSIRAPASVGLDVHAHVDVLHRHEWKTLICRDLISDCEKPQGQLQFEEGIRP